MAPSSTADRPVKLACRSVWKVFGRDADKFLADRVAPPSGAELAEAGMIGAVRNVSLDIADGESFIVMGLSGSGKSTLLRCLSRLVEPTAGQVLFEGRDLLKASQAELIEIRRHKMGMVFQNFALLPHLNVLDNVAFPLAIQDVPKAERIARAHEVIELVGLKGREGAFPRELSGGQQQRVGIARSLAVGPALWFLDEPFSALDPLIRREMQAELQRLQAVLKKTIVFVTHDFDEAIRLADRIAIMKDGEVIQIGTPEQLVLNPATDYVAEFTRDVQRAKVMSVKSLMQKANGTRDYAGEVKADQKIAAIAARVVESGRTFAVVDAGGALVGEIAPQPILDLLIGRGAAGVMTDATLSAGARPIPLHRLIWALLIALMLVLGIWHELLPWAADYPKSAILPFAKLITAFFKAIIDSVSWFTRGLSAVLQAPLDFAIALLAKGFKLGNGPDALVIPRLSWIGILAVVTLMGHALGGRRTAIVAFLCFAYLALFGQWDRAMLTLALVAVCVPVGVLLGLVIGIAAYRSVRLDTYVVRPGLDLMQTIPAFAYIIPILFLFGFTPVTPLIATVAFAMPPMVRATTLALHRVPAEIQEFGDMAGCTGRQKLWRILLPSAKPTLMIGVNQVIMLTLNMVIIASMVGADGLGYDVLFALRGQKIGVGLEAGLAITALAIALDRLSQAAADSKVEFHRPGTPFYQRHPYLLTGIAVLLLTTLIGLFVPNFAAVPKGWTVTTAPVWDALVKWVNINFFDYFEAVRTVLLLGVLNPIKQSLLKLPWLVAVLLAAFAGYRLRDWRLGLLAGVLVAFQAVVGLWDKAMITVYLCAISAFISCLIGIPLGVIATRNVWFDRVQRVVVDTLQTLPSFVYLIPVVMLFRVGDVTALIAIVAFAVTPAIRYTIHGIRQVPPHLIEAAVATGCTRRQILWRVQLPLALPEIMLGINQTILFALSMLVITALVGTRDLGQEVYIALTKVDTGRGIIAGLCVAFLGIVADRLLRAAADRFRRRLGLAASAGIG